MRRRWRYAPVATVLLSALMGVRSAAAQTADPPRVSIGVGAGVADLFHGDYPFTARAWGVPIRVQVSPHVLVEPQLTQWRHTDRAVFMAVPTSGPGGVTGLIGRTETSTAYTQTSVGVNVLGTGSSGRVRLSGGGGISLLSYNRVFSQTLTDCSPQVASVCGTHVNEFSNGSFGIEGVATMDVRVSRRIAAFGEYRLSFPITDFGSGDSTFLLGVRIGIR